MDLYADMELYWGDNKTAIASWSENVENAKDFLLKLFTDKDIANLIQYGTEGQDYELDENNRITVTTSSRSVYEYQDISIQIQKLLILLFMKKMIKLPTQIGFIQHMEIIFLKVLGLMPIL